MRKLFVLIASGALAAGLLTATGSAAGRSSHAGACRAHVPGKMGRFGGIISAHAIAGSPCTGEPTNPVANPPLLWGGGPVMGTDLTGPITVTPIYWEPNGYFNAGDYRLVINQYLNDVAAASGSTSNVFSTATEYYGNNGSNADATQNRISYSIVAGAAIRDHNPFPKGGCTVGNLDKSGIYEDGSGYTDCVDDAQVTAEIQKVITALHLPQNDYSHEYVMLTPKHVASCFYGLSTSNKHNVCTIDHYPSSIYCAYHTMFGPNYPASGTVYANMPFPVYHSPVGFTCGTDAKGHGIIESPNNQRDADVEISPLSHELMESITDPNTTNGWADASGNENGDDCAYVYGTMSGAAGARYNQTINGHFYISQEEFSNADWLNTAHAGGCVPGESAVTPGP
jgi:hypothetical protein